MGKSYTKICDSLTSKLKIKEGCCLIKKGDTCPIFKIMISDPETGSPVSFLNWEVQIFMWFNSFIGSEIDDISDEVTFSLLGNKNFCQIKVGDIIRFEDCNQNIVEFMEVESIDSDNFTITATRGDFDDVPSIPFTHFKKDSVTFYRIFEKNGFIDSIFEDNSDTADIDERDYSVIAYQWDSEDTSHRGEYLLEFKVTDGDLIRTFPLNSEGFCIQII
jgi:hypothetical protein